MYAITFKPQLKQTIWGGDKIKGMKNIVSPFNNIGESWEVSGVEGNVSVVADGEFMGRNLNDLVAEMKGELVGKHVYERFGDEFPLLVKFIDAHQDLSIQVHPNDEQARARGLKRGKTEMWYVMDSDSNASLRCGLKRAITPLQYKAMVADGSITDAICRYDVKAGDCFFIPAGRVHSIGAGCFLAEIQETSDVTYRIYDFKRKDKYGHYRQLHTSEAAKVIDYGVAENYRTEYRETQGQPSVLVNCDHFVTSLYNIGNTITLDFSPLDSFVILICVKGNGAITDRAGRTTALTIGSSVLLPAKMPSISASGCMKLLETHIP